MSSTSSTTNTMNSHGKRWARSVVVYCGCIYIGMYLHFVGFSLERLFPSTSTSFSTFAFTATATATATGGNEIENENKYQQEPTHNDNKNKNNKKNNKSLHPKWKLWEEMNPEQQHAALQELYPYLDKYGNLLNAKKVGNSKNRGENRYGNCTFHEFGAMDRVMCDLQDKRDPNDCVFISFGINNDPTFEVELANQWKCRGFAGDPTVSHPSKLHPLVTFHNVAATMVADNDERKANKGGEEKWWTTSMPSLKRWLGLDKIDILKIDCEGCEIAFGRDIIVEDPIDFLASIDQLSVEFHVTKSWINSTREFYYFALNFALIEEAGFILQSTLLFGCGRRELKGCRSEFDNTTYPCGYRLRPAGKNGNTFPYGWSCQEFLWIKP